MTDDFSLRLTAQETETLNALLKRSQISEEIARAERAKKRKPCRFKGKLKIGPEFFHPLSDQEIDELTGG